MLLWAFVEIERSFQSTIILPLAASAFVLVTTIVLSVSAMSLTNVTRMEIMTPFAKAASKSIESNLSLMADRIFMIGENQGQEQHLLSDGKLSIRYA